MPSDPALPYPLLQVCLLGDSAHAMVPFYGQGMNSGFEDVLAFNEILDQTNDNLAKAVPLFGKTREKDGEAIAELSMLNYIEMSHHSGDAMFRLRKKFEGVLNWMLPGYWVPLYKMVAFTRIPYHQVNHDRALPTYHPRTTHVPPSYHPHPNHHLSPSPLYHPLMALAPPPGPPPPPYHQAILRSDQQDRALQNGQNAVGAAIGAGAVYAALKHTGAGKQIADKLANTAANFVSARDESRATPPPPPPPPPCPPPPPFFFSFSLLGLWGGFEGSAWRGEGDWKLSHS